MKLFKNIEVPVLGCIIYDFLCSGRVYPGLILCSVRTWAGIQAFSLVLPGNT